MQKDLLISIVMPVYKVIPYIKDSVLSVINQTYKNIDFILVDDGDPDRSWEIAETVLKEKNFQYRIIHQPNAGLGGARNTGLKVASGEYVYFIDADDVILKETIDRMVSSIQNNEDLIVCDYKDVFKPEDVIEKYSNAEPIFTNKEQISNDFLSRKKKILAPGTLYRKDFLKMNSLLFENIPWSEDQHFIWRVLAKCNGAIYLGEKLYQYYRRESSITSTTSIEKIEKSYIEIKKLSAYFEDIEFGKQVVSRWAVGSIGGGCRFLKFREWKNFYYQLDGKANFKQIRGIADTKTKVISYLGELTPYMFYMINRLRCKVQYKNVGCKI